MHSNADSLIPGTHYNYCDFDLDRSKSRSHPGSASDDLDSSFITQGQPNIHPKHHINKPLRNRSSSIDLELFAHQDQSQGQMKNIPTKGFSGKKMARDLKWRELSQPKHPKASIKLREKIESEIRSENRTRPSRPLIRVTTLPTLDPHASAGLITGADRRDATTTRPGDTGSHPSHRFLRVPGIQGSKSHENVAGNAVAGNAVAGNAAEFETLVDLESAPLSGRRGRRDQDVNLPVRPDGWNPRGKIKRQLDRKSRIQDGRCTGNQEAPRKSKLPTLN